MSGHKTNWQLHVLGMLIFGTSQESKHLKSATWPLLEAVPACPNLKYTE